MSPFEKYITCCTLVTLRLFLNFLLPCTVYRDIHIGKRDAAASKGNESVKNGKKSANGNISKSLKAKKVSNTKNKNSATESAKNLKKKVPNGREIKPKDRNITIISKDGTSNKAKKK